MWETNSGVHIVTAPVKSPLILRHDIAPSDEDEIDLLVKKIKAAESLGDSPMVARLKLKLENI